MATTNGRVGVAIFGMGRAGSIHVKNLAANPRVNIRWIVEEDVAKAKPYVDKYYLENTQVISNRDVDQVWNDLKTAAIVVCVPTHHHEAIIMGGLNNGKAVFSEKPVALTLESTKQCYMKAAEKQLPLLCAFNRRFDPSIRAVRNRVKGGEVGQVQSVKTTARDAPFPPIEYLKISGGLYHDCAVHDIDLITWILGEMPVSVFAQGHAFHDEVRAMNDVDQATIVLKFASGVMASVDLNREAVYGYDQRVEVFGSKGMLEVQNKRDTEVASHGTSGETKDLIEPSFAQRYSQAYVLEMEHFLDVVQGITEKVEVSMEDTLSVSWIADLCEQSMHTGRVVAFTKPVC